MLELLPIRLRARGITRVPTLVRIRSSGTLRDLGENAERKRRAKKSWGRL